MTDPSSSFGVTESGDPDAPLVVLVHGALDRSSGMARLARRLADRACVVRYDRRGYGRAVDLPGPYTIDSHVTDLVSILEGRPAVLFGHSLGAHIVLATADRHPHLVRAVAIFEPPLSWADWWAARRRPSPSDPGDAAETFMRRMVGDHVFERLPRATQLARRAEGRAFVDESADLRRGRPWDPVRIRCEVRVGHGSESGRRFARAAQEVAAALGTSAVLVPGAGHGGHTSSAADVASLLVLPLGVLSSTGVPEPRR